MLHPTPGAGSQAPSPAGNLHSPGLPVAAGSLLPSAPPSLQQNLQAGSPASQPPGSPAGMVQAGRQASVQTECRMNSQLFQKCNSRPGKAEIVVLQENAADQAGTASPAEIGRNGRAQQNTQQQKKWQAERNPAPPSRRPSEMSPGRKTRRRRGSVHPNQEHLQCTQAEAAMGEQGTQNEVQKIWEAHAPEPTCTQCRTAAETRIPARQPRYPPSRLRFHSSPSAAVVGGVQPLQPVR